METVPQWVLLVCLGALGTLAVLLWKGSDKRLDKHSERLDDHEKRLTKTEEQVHAMEAEVGTLRARWHDLKDEISSTLGGWYIDLVKRIRGEK